MAAVDSIGAWLITRFTRAQWWGHVEYLRECDSCGEHGYRSGEVDGNAGDAGARDCKGEESEGGALGIEGEGEEGDLVWGGVIGGEIVFEGDGTAGA